MVKLLVMTIIMNVNQIVVSLVKALKALVRQLVVSSEAILSHRWRLLGNSGEYGEVTAGVCKKPVAMASLKILLAAFRKYM